MNRTEAIYLTLNETLKIACERFNRLGHITPRVIRADFTNPDKVVFEEIVGSERYFQGARGKRELSQFTKQALKMAGPGKDYGYINVTEGWAVINPQGVNIDNMPAPSLHPERKEVITCVIHVHDGTHMHFCQVEAASRKAIFSPVEPSPDRDSWSAFGASPGREH